MTDSEILISLFISSLLDCLGFPHIVLINVILTTSPSCFSPRGHRRLRECLPDRPEARRTADSELHSARSGAGAFFLGYPQQRRE